MIFETSKPGMSSFPVILDELRRMNFALQEQRATHTLSYHPCEVAKYFQTVRIDAGRQTSKTSYVLNNAREGDIIIVPNMYIANHITRSFDIPCGIVIMHDLMRLNPSRITGTVWVDEASLCVDGYNSLEFMYMTFAGHAKQFVLLG